MKRNRMKQLLSGFLAVLLVAACFPAGVLAAESEGESARMSPLAGFFDESQLNPDYIEWIENGRQGEAPPAQDLSYLAESYARLCARQNSIFPAQYDLREKGLVEPVPDQGNLGICWAVAANSAAVSPLLRQTPQMSFLPVHTAWFTYAGTEEMEIYSVADPYQAGGSSATAVATMAAWKGPVLSGKESMEDYQDSPPVEESRRWDADYHLQDAYYMPYGRSYPLDTVFPQVTNEIVKQLLMENGAISISYYSSDEGTSYNDKTFAWYHPEQHTTDHAVLLVGWDDNFSKDNFNTPKPQNNGAWLIRNSWGTQVGDDGYQWISYEDKSIRFGNTFVLEENDNYKNNYQYDTGGWSYSLPTNMENQKKAKAANIFTAKDDEILEAVSFYTTDADTKYSISVYTGVQAGDPESGRKAFENPQTGTELYVGYHTIELKEPVKLTKGERFSIVLEVENPTYAYPLAIEWYEKQTPDDFPKYMGTGGQSYIYSDKWDDAAGSLNDLYYITNVCIKGFTNPLPDDGEAISTVRFSEMEGPVPDGTTLTLTAEGGEDIYYSIDGSGPTEGSSLKLDFSQASTQTVSAYAVKDGKRGNTVEKEYFQAEAQLTDLAVKAGEEIFHLDTTSEAKIDEISVPSSVECITIMAQSGDNITVNRTELKSGKWTQAISLKDPGEPNEIEIAVTRAGKTSNTYKVTVRRSILSFDYAAETVQFDDTKYTVQDASGKEIKNGDCITFLISTKEKTELTVTPKGGGARFSDYIPKRRTVSGVDINYLEEQTDVSFPAVYAYSKNADMSDKVQLESTQPIPLTPGQDLYIQRQATEDSFVGEVFHLTVPARPAAPKVAVANVTKTSVTLKEIKGAVYSQNGEDWQESPEFSGLAPGTQYSFYARIPATETSFYSEIGFVSAITSRKSSSSSGRPSSGSGSSSSGNISIPADPSQPVTGTIGTISGQTGTAAIPDTAVQTVIRNAQRAARPRQGVAVSVPVSTAQNQTSLSLTLQGATLDKLVQANVTSLKVTASHMISVNLDQNALKRLDTVSGGANIVLKVDDRRNHISSQAQSAIGNRPVYDVNLYYVSGGIHTQISDLGGGKVRITLPYTPAAEEEVSRLRAVYVDEKGNVEWMQTSCYDAVAKAIVWESSHFSVYGVGYQTAKPVQLDTSTVRIMNGGKYSFLVKDNHDVSNIQISVSNPNILEVILENGMDSRGAKYGLKAKAIGTTDVLVTYQGATARMRVNITESKGSITLDTANYIMAPGNRYDIGAVLRDANGNALNAEQVLRLVASGQLQVSDSRTGSIIDLQQLPNGNFRVTGKNAGTAYIIYEIGGTHASVRIDVQKGAKQGGTAVRNTSYFTE